MKTRDASLTKLLLFNSTCLKSNWFYSIVFVITFCIPAHSQIPTNDECANAILLTSSSSCTPVSGTTLNATNSIPAATCNTFLGNADDDVWYKFVAVRSAHTITVTPGPYDIVMELRSGTCPGVKIDCADIFGMGATETINATGLTVGNTYYIRLYSFAGPGSGGAFNICVTHFEAAGDECTSAFPLTSGLVCSPLEFSTLNATSSLPAIQCNSLTGVADDDLWFSFVAVRTTHTILVHGEVSFAGFFNAVVELRSGSCPGVNIACADQTGGPGDETITANGLTIGNTYYIRVYSFDGAHNQQGYFTICVTHASVANDECANAVTLTPGNTCVPVSVNTTNATPSLPPAILCNGLTGYADDDVWYKFVATSTAHKIIATGLGNADAVIELRSACGGPVIACADFGGFGQTETLEYNAFTPGNTYFVRLFEFQPGAGSFDICVTNSCTITCPNDTVVSAPVGACGTAVNYSPVTTTGPCSGISYNPASGSFFTLGTHTVNVSTLSGQTCSFTVTVNSSPAVAGTIQGITNACRGTTATYCIPNIPGISIYLWTLPAGATGSSTTNCITVNFGNSFVSGTLSVTPLNPCGSATASFKSISYASVKPTKPSAITGLAPVCASSSPTFCVAPVAGAESYLWSIGGNGGSAPLTLGVGQGTNCIVVNVPAGYNGNQELKVRAVNCKGQSDDQKTDLKLLLVPAMPGNITGPSAVCLSQLGFYSISSVTGASTYIWSVNGNVWIAGGQGSTNLALDFSTANSSLAQLSVTAQNYCGTSAPNTKSIVINNSCKEGSDVILKDAVVDLDANVYPNPTSGKITLQFTSESDSKYRLKIYDMTGRIIFSQDITATAGLNIHEADLSSLAKQVYLLRLENENGSRTIRIGVE